MPKLNIQQLLFLFFVAGLLFGYTSPLSGIGIVLVFALVSWEDLFTK